MNPVYDLISGMIRAWWLSYTKSWVRELACLHSNRAKIAPTSSLGRRDLQPQAQGFRLRDFSHLAAREA